MKLAYLVKINCDNNNNRFYRMIADGSVFRIEMGRIGATPVLMKRPISLWDVTYKQKLAEGYVDRTDYTSAEKVFDDNAKYKPIPEPSVEDLINTLMQYANKALKDSYTISYSEVNERMIRDAQEAIRELGEELDVDEFNEKLLKLFQIIPRKMKTVSEMVAADVRDFEKILEREQDLLDLMRTKIRETSKTSQKLPDRTILDDLGLEIRPCTEKENDQIKKYLTAESAHLFKRAFRIHNLETDRQFDSYCRQHDIHGKDIHYFYHGSKNMNYMGIMSEGLKLNPNAPITGKMFGHGIYFATRAKKSIGYTNLDGSFWAKGTNKQAYLAVFKVAYKNPMHVYQHEHYFTRLRNVLPHDAMFAHAGTMLRNDEIIVYDQNQATLQYLIELEK